MNFGLILVCAFVLIFFPETSESNDFFQVSNNPTLLELSKAYNRYRNIGQSRSQVRPNSESFSVEDVKLQTAAPETTTQKPRKRKHKGKKNRRKKGRKHRKHKTTTTSTTTTSTSTTQTPAIVLNENALDAFEVKSNGDNTQFDVPVLSAAVLATKGVETSKPTEKTPETTPKIITKFEKVWKQDVSELDPKTLPQGKRSYSAISGRNSLLTGSKRANSPKGRGVDAANQTTNANGVVPYMDFKGPPPIGGDGGDNNTASSGREGGQSEVTVANYATICQVAENEVRKQKCKLDVNSKPDDDTNANKPVQLTKDGQPIVDETMSDSQLTGQLHTVAMQNRKLIIQFITEALYPSTVAETEPINGFKLLNTTKSIFSKLCPPSVIRPQFLDMAEKAFKKIHDLTTPKRTPFISDVEFGWINEILQGCLSGAKPAGYIQDDCKEEVLAVNKTTSPLCLGYIINDGRNRSTACYQTNTQVFDPVLDIIWLMFESVKASCFDNFQGNIRLFQRYGVAMLDLYSRPMKFRWALQQASTEYWERILGPGLDLALRNIDKCAHHIINLSPFDFRTPRFMNINSVRLSHSNTKYL